MEGNLCTICSNTLNKEEELFHPCECDMKFCFYCFRDLFEKIHGNLQGLCPQCRKPLKARIQVPQKAQKRELDISNKNFLRKVRVLIRKSLYLQCVPAELSILQLQTVNFLGKYGEIKDISIELKYFQADPPGTYRVFVHYLDDISAAKAVLALNGHVIGKIHMKAEYMMANFCGNFLKNKQCYIRNCKFLHEVPNECEWYTLEEMNKVDLSKPKDVESYDVGITTTGSFPVVTLKKKSESFSNIFVPKRSSKYTPKYIPVSNITFKASESSPVDSCNKKLTSISEYSDILQHNPKKTTKGGVFHLLSEDDD